MTITFISRLSALPGALLLSLWSLPHRRRLGGDEWLRRYFAALNIAQQWKRRREVMSAPPLGWTILGLWLLAYGAVCHRRLLSFESLFGEVARIVEEKNERRRQWRAEQSERARRRAAWEAMRHQFEAFAQRQGGGQQRQRQQTCAGNAYQLALDLLGLNEPFDRPTMVKAYRKAIIAVHPDRGGSTEEAQAVNGARDLIVKYKGW